MFCIPNYITTPETVSPHPMAGGSVPAPLRMDPPPHPAGLARDGYKSIPNACDGYINGWLVFDASGLCRTRLWFFNGGPESRLHFELLAFFERLRHQKGDRQFKTDPFDARIRQSKAAAPGEETRYGLVEYEPLVCDDRGLAVVNADQTRTVNVFMNTHIIATYVLDASGQVVDGYSAWGDEEEPTQEMRDLATAFWLRRAAAGDAYVTDVIDIMLAKQPSAGAAR